MKKEEYLEYIRDTISPFYHIQTRKMFGGYGLYTGGKIFAIIVDQELYFKANDEAAKFFMKFDSEQFSYDRDGKQIYMSYWKVPHEVLDDGDLLKEWIDFALS